jgi:hypothetical protein
MTQGSSFLATLGWRTESRWDSHKGAGGRIHCDTVRANLELADWFEEFSRNHAKKTNRQQVGLITIPIAS